MYTKAYRCKFKDFHKGQNYFKIKTYLLTKKLHLRRYYYFLFHFNLMSYVTQTCHYIGTTLEKNVVIENKLTFTTLASRKTFFIKN